MVKISIIMRSLHFFQKKVKKLVDIYIAQWYYLTCVGGKPYEIRHAGVLELADRLD